MGPSPQQLAVFSSLPPAQDGPWSGWELGRAGTLLGGPFVLDNGIASALPSKDWAFRLPFPHRGAVSHPFFPVTWSAF